MTPYIWRDRDIHVIRERERERERERDGEREADNERDRQIGRQKNRQRDRVFFFFLCVVRFAVKQNGKYATYKSFDSSQKMWSAWGLRASIGWIRTHLFRIRRNKYVLGNNTLNPVTHRERMRAHTHTHTHTHTHMRTRTGTILVSRKYT